MLPFRINELPHFQAEDPLYQWDNGTPVFVPRSTEFKFADRVKKRDALDEFDEIEQGHGV